jgi:hypothetical protein
MKKISFIPMLIFIFLSIASAFFINLGTKDVVTQKTVYLIGPIIAIIAGLMSLRKMGWKGKRPSVIINVIIALCLWFIAECITLYMIFVGVEPYPSLSDLFFLVGYVFFSRAVYLEARLFDLNIKKLNKRVSLLLGLAFVFVVGIVISMAIKGFRPEDSLLANLTTISWSMGDLIMGGLSIALLAMVWTYRTGTVKKEWLWFISATTINLIADSIYNLNPNAISDGSLWTVVLDLMWVSGYLLMAGYFLEIRKGIIKIQSKTL